MRCETVEKRLQDAVPLTAAERAHVEECSRCAASARRWEAWRTGLARRGEDIEPGPGFAAAVVTSLPRHNSPMEWAALRLLPASAALVLALTGWCVLRGLTPSMVTSSVSTQDALTWVLEGGGGGS
jgi:hypothetical protein